VPDSESEEDVRACQLLVNLGHPEVDEMETEEEEEIEDVDILQEPRLMTEIDDFVEDAPIPASKKKKKSSQGPPTVAKQRKNKCDPRRFQFSVTITLTGEDLDRDRFAPLLEEFVKNNTEKAIVAFERGEVECHLHAQCLMIAITTTPTAFKLSIAGPHLITLS
jgi:hypothetical protein